MMSIGGNQRPLGRSTETSAFSPCTDIVGQSDHFRKVPQVYSSVPASSACLILIEQQAGEKWDEPPAGTRSQPGTRGGLSASVGRTPSGPWYRVNGSAVGAASAAHKYLRVWHLDLRRFAVDSRRPSGVCSCPHPAYLSCHGSHCIALYPPSA